MSEPIRLTEMLAMAKGEVASLADLIALHRAKHTRPENWIEQHQRILQHRRQVVLLIESEIERRSANKEKAA